MSDEDKDKNLSKKKRGRIPKYREQIRKLHREGYEPKEIQDKIGASQPTISKELKIFREEDPLDYVTRSESEEEERSKTRIEREKERKALSKISFEKKEPKEKTNEDGKIKLKVEVEHSDKRKNQADRLIQLVENQDIRLFTDQRKDAYIKFPRDIYRYEIRRIESRTVKTWLVGLMYDAENKAPYNQALTSVINLLVAKAHKNSEITLYNRIAPNGSDGIYIDMADESWRAIHVNKDGWNVTDNPPIFFYRYNHQRPLPEPIPNGNIDLILPFTNIKNKDDQLLIKTTIISYFIPELPHVGLYIHGPQGCGKSQCQKFIREIIDPAKPMTHTMKRKDDEIIQQLDHNYIIIFDNVTKILEWQSNILCQAITGAGSSKRRLYTIDDDYIREFYRIIFLNGLNMVADRADLLDRFVTIHLENPIDEREKIPKRELEAEFNEKKGWILGGILDILVKAMNIYPELKLDKLKRMADYTKWGYAITKAMGENPENFIKIYTKNIENQNREIMKGSPIGEVLVSFMATQKNRTWKGTYSQLLPHLNAVAGQLGISIKSKDWPRNPRILSQRMNELQVSLPSVGYRLIKKRTGRAKVISIIPIDNNGDANDAKNGINKSLEKDYSLNSYFKKNNDEQYSQDKTMKLGKDVKNSVTSVTSVTKDVETQKPLTLKEKLDTVLHVVNGAQEFTGIAKEETIFSILLDVYKIDRSEAEKFIDVLKRDGMIYSPRIGYYKVIRP